VQIPGVKVGSIEVETVCIWELGGGGGGMRREFIELFDESDEIKEDERVCIDFELMNSSCDARFWFNVVKEECPSLAPTVLGERGSSEWEWRIEMWRARDICRITLEDCILQVEFDDSMSYGLIIMVREWAR